MQDLWNPLFFVAAIVSLSFMLRYSKNVEQEKAISLLNENNRLLRELIAELRKTRGSSSIGTEFQTDPLPTDSSTMP
jgi:uncharacterized ion transporter superfamily protein YfcC